MKRHRKIREFLFVAVAFLLCQAVLALTICRKCGHEVAEGAAVCGHCKEPVVRKVETEPVNEPVKTETDAGGSVEKLAEDYVRDQYNMARECQENNPGLAFAYYQNAFAVLRLVPADERSERVGTAILSNMGVCRKAMCTGRVHCRVCKGTGKYKVEVGKVSGTKNIKFVDGIQCSRCNGKGYLTAHLSVDRVKMNVLKGRQAFEQRQMVANDRKLGRAYVSQEIYDKLDQRQRVLVMTGLHAPCKECQYTGIEICRECRGSCWEECPAENCNDGVIEKANESAGNYKAKKRLNSDLQEQCGMCQGWGEIPCRSCQGKGCQICEECGGTGEAPRCAKCQGTGLVTCTRCNGTGEYKGEKCSKCAGEGEFLCTTCKGEGSVSR